MNIPFTIDQFLAVFENYNLSIWPFQIILNLLALIVIFLSFQRIKFGNKINSGILAFFWIWIGIVYHLINFTTINKAAYLFFILNLFQGFIFLYAGIYKDYLSFKFHVNIYSFFGILFVIYALMVYPILGYFLGHVYPKSPTFGLPCSTTIFTFGVLLWTDKRIPQYVLVIPLIWSIFGFGAALSLRILEDYGLLVAGLTGSVLLFVRDKVYQG